MHNYTPRGSASRILPMFQRANSLHMLSPCRLTGLQHSLAYKTLITQEMLAKGYLAANSVYVCIEHTPKVVDGYFEALDGVFSLDTAGVR